MDEVRLILFGSPRVERCGQPVEMDTRKALALFAYLAVSGVEQQRETLVALLYPEADPESARAAFRRTLSTLHSALGDGVLSIRREAVGLAANVSLWVDVLRFRELVEHSDDEPSLSEAASLYRDHFMAGFSLRDSPSFDDWQYHQSEELRQMLDRSLEKLASSYAVSGNYSAAIQAAERRVRLDSLLEEAHRQLMELYARSSQRSNALRQYRECVRVLEQELGVAPLEETTRLYQQILSGKLESAPAERVEKTAPAPAQPPSPASQASPLVGRRHEMADLRSVLHADSTGGWLVALEGEAGIGKTRLAEEFLSLARQTGRAVAQARCYEGQFGLAYAPFLEAVQGLLPEPGMSARIAALPPSVLVEASRLFPSLTKEPAPPPLAEGPGAQTRFFEALRLLVNALLGGSHPGILFIDDLHWADSGTLDFITYLARRLRPAGCILMAAWRSEQTPANERLNQLLAELERGKFTLHMSLSRLNPAEIKELAHKVGADLTSPIADRLYRESEGLPFIALEYLHSSQTLQADWKMPGGVRALLHRRLQEPGEVTRQLLSAAAVIGRSFDFDMLLAISGRSEWETVNGVEELVRLGLIREQAAENGYDFSHEKLRALAYEETSLARRCLLHLRAAETLASTAHSGREADGKAGLIANHFLQAGHPARAADYFRQAGDHARRLHANGEALSAYQAALAAGHPDPSNLHEACGDLFTLQGEYGAAISSYQAAAAFCTPGCLPNLMHKLGEVYHRKGEWEAAESHYQAALESAGEGESTAWKAHLFADWSLTAYRARQPRQAQSLAGQAYELGQVGKDPAALSQALNMLGILARAQGDLDQAGAYFEQSLRAADALDNLALRCAALHNLARLEQERSRPQQAIPLAKQALEYCTLLGDRHHQAALLNTLADLHHILGREAESMEYLKQAVSLFAEIGEEGGRDQPEIWKLTEW